MKKLLVAVLLLTNIFYTPALAAAESLEFSITGNGSDSASTINASAEQSTQSSQSNNTQVENNLESTSNTGENNVSGNTNDVSLQTGDTATNLQVENSQINTNVIETTNCSNCNQTQVTIADNGAGSNNQVELAGSKTNNISQQNSAVITTSIHIDANTGRNIVTDNSGDVKVITGDIKSNTTVQNSGINYNQATISGGSPFGKITAKVSGNGTNSHNNLVVTINQDNTWTVSNNADINNYLSFNFNTGDNKVVGNTGAKVFISTGDILANVAVSNTGINSNHVYFIDCEIDPDKPTDPQDPQDPGDDDDSDDHHHDSGHHDAHIGGAVASSDNNSSSGNGGQVLGAILPITGANLAAILLANSASILAGLMIRFRKLWYRLGLTRVNFLFTVRWD